jgi:hypothetical protein
MVVRNAQAMLNPEGRIAYLDWKDAPMAIGPPKEIRLFGTKAKNLMEAAGLKVVSVQDAGPYHYMIIAGR